MGVAKLRKLKYFGDGVSGVFRAHNYPNPILLQHLAFAIRSNRRSHPATLHTA